MRVVALVSGGKDSCFNMMQCVAAGHEIVALANLQPGGGKGNRYNDTD
jgi:diphthine-ammonia ligase